MAPLAESRRRPTRWPRCRRRRCPTGAPSAGGWGATGPRWPPAAGCWSSCCRRCSPRGSRPTTRARDRSACGWRRSGTPGHVLGTDEQGRDMLSRLLWGGRMTLVAGLTPVLVAFVLGSALGIAGRLRGRTHQHPDHAHDGHLLRVPVRAARDRHLGRPRSRARQHADLALDRVHPAGGAGGGVRHRAGEGARVHRGGAGERRGRGSRSCATTCSPTCWGPILVFASTQVSLSIILAAGLSFLGLGVTPPAAEWGLMLNTLRQSIYVNALVPALPGLAIFVTSMAFNLLSDGLRDAMEIARADRARSLRGARPAQALSAAGRAAAAHAGVGARGRRRLVRRERGRDPRHRGRVGLRQVDAGPPAPAPDRARRGHA